MAVSAKYMNWPTLYEFVTSLEHQLWHSDGGRDKLAKCDASYITTLIDIRWDNIGRPCKADMSDVTFKELLPYYMFLVDLFDEYDPIPDYVECMKRYDKLIDMIPAGAFIDSDETLPYITEEMREIYYGQVKIAESSAVGTDQVDVTDPEELHDGDVDL